MLLRGIEVFDCPVEPEHEEGMANLMKVSKDIALWLVMAGIGPDRFYIEVEEPDEEFLFGYRIDYYFQDVFEEEGKDFWKFVSGLVPLREPLLSDIYSDDLEPLNTRCTGSNGFLLMIQPDLDALDYKFPPQEFWNKRYNEYQIRYEAKRAEHEAKRLNRPLKLIANNGCRLDQQL